MRNLSTTGLSMSQAQSVSNLCNQAATEISNRLMAVNNASKTIEIDGKSYIETEGIPMPDDVAQLLLDKARYHACQAFLMEAIKSKDDAIEAERHRAFTYDVTPPVHKEAEDFEMLLPVPEQWGWDQLTDAEYAEYLDNEAYASHIGQFIHNKGKLDTLRKELNTIKGLQWLSIKEGEQTPVMVNKHHTSEQLMALHEKLAESHRLYEQRVNYYKAKVKNLVAEENARRSHENALRGEEFNKIQAKLDEEYSFAMQAWRGERQVALQQFEKEREINIKTISALRIVVDPRFQAIIDRFLGTTKE